MDRQDPSLFLFLLCLLVAIIHSPTTNAQRPHEGVHINFVVEDRVSANLFRHQEAFQDASGATVDIIEFPFDDLFGQIMGDLRDGSPLYDGFVFPPNQMVDFIKCPNCSLEVLTERVRNNEELAWHDISPYFRSHNSVFDGQVYTVTLDGDVHYLYYNLDVLEELGRSVPTTWEEYEEISALAHGRDWNGDGEPDYGSCIARAPKFQSQFFLFQVVSSFLQSKGSSQGIYFDVDTMDPLVDSEGFREGLAMYMRLREHGPPVETNVVDIYHLMVEGRCAFAPTWADIGPLSRDSRGLPTSTWDKIGAAIGPGVHRVWDYQQNKWHVCSEEPSECPFAGDDYVNHAPFAANGGWSGAIPENIPDDRKNAAFAFLAFLGANSDVDVMAGTGFDPYRTSHLDLDLWLANGFNERAAEAQIAGLSETLRSSNLVVDLRIQGANDYVNVVLDDELFRLNKDEITQDEFVSRIYSAWQGITDKLGRRELLQQYRATIGLPPKDFAEEVEVTEAGRIALAVVSGLFALCCICLCIFVYLYRDLKVWRFASPNFLFGSLIGAILAYVGIILMSADASTGTCTSALWLYVVGMSLILGNIFAKTYRTWRLFSNQNHFFLVKIHDHHILPISLVVMSLAIVILIVWTVMDAPTVHRSTKGVDDLEYVLICDSTDHGLEFFVTTVAYFGFLLLVALFLSFNTRNVGDAFNESKVLTLCVYNLTQVLIIVIVCALALDSPDARYILVVICLIFGVTVTIGLLFIPKVWITVQGKGDEVSSTRTRGSTGGTNQTNQGTDMDA